jgi:hypothetical protein
MKKKFKPLVQPISFDAWFHIQARVKKVRFEQKEEISIFFKKNNLTKYEDFKIFDEMLKKY